MSYLRALAHNIRYNANHGSGLRRWSAIFVFLLALSLGVLALMAIIAGLGAIVVVSANVLPNYVFVGLAALIVLFAMVIGSGSRK